MIPKAISRRAFSGQVLALAAIVPATSLSAVRPAHAAGLAVPTERALLTISGKIRVTNVGETAQFDRPMLEALGMRSFTTQTPWYDQKVLFEGPTLVSILEAVGAYGENLTAIALNDYATKIPISDFSRFGTILALKRDGNYLSVREKGPLFVVYPYDSDPELKQQKYYGRSAWQVAQFVIA